MISSIPARAVTRRHEDISADIEGGDCTLVVFECASFAWDTCALEVSVDLAIAFAARFQAFRAIAFHVWRALGGGGSRRQDVLLLAGGSADEGGD